MTLALTRDPVTLDACAKINGDLYPVKPGTTVKDLREKPMDEVLEDCRIRRRAR